MSDEGRMGPAQGEDAGAVDDVRATPGAAMGWEPAAGEAGPAPTRPVPAAPVRPAAPVAPAAPVSPWDHCAFLAAIDLDDRIRPAVLVPDTANRCLSTGEPVAPTARDQAALCLAGEHRACPRFVRASTRTREPEPLPSRGPRLSAPIAAAAGVLGLAALLAGVSLAAQGDLSAGLGGTSTTAPAATAAAGAGGPAASSGPGVAAASDAVATPAVATEPPAPTPVPTLAAITPAATAAPTPTPAPKKYKGLTPCPGAADCYIYVVKRGDALAAVAARYGLTLDEVLARNPKIKDPGLIVLGQKIRMPTPRR